MSDSLYSPNWYRVAALHPQLRPQVVVSRQPSRGRDWYVLHNQANGRFHRVNAQAYQVVGRLDGRHSLEEVWQSLLTLLGDDAPSQADVLRILGQLTEADLLQGDSVPDIRRLSRHSQRRVRGEQRARMNPLSFKLSLFDPSVLLQRLDGVARAVFSRMGAALWLLLVAAGVAVGIGHHGEILAHARGTLLQPHALLMMWAAYPVLKALHEAGHALALQRWQCDTHEVGVSFMLLVPLPYVDASASLALQRRWQRGVVAGAGIAVEVAAAALAALVWLAVEPGMVRDLALVVMTLGGVSTLVFNGNPLLRYDGYYLLCDAMDLPNLGARSGQVWRDRLLQLLARLSGAPGAARDAAAGVDAGDRIERLALTLYAPLSWVYRGLVGLVVVSVLAPLSAALGLAAALWMLWTTLGQPLWNWIGLAASAPQLEPVRLRARLLAGGLVALLVAGVVWLPLPSSEGADGIVWLPDEAQLRTRTAGTVADVLVRDGDWVRRGQPLVRLEEPGLLAERAVQQARVEAGLAEQTAAWGSEPVRVRQAEEGLRRDRAALAEAERQIGQLVLRAADEGRFVLAAPQAADLLQRDVPQGEVLGYVLPRQALRVRAVVTERDVDRWRDALRLGAARLSVRLADQPDRIWPARVLRQAPAAVERLPAAALGEPGGGAIPTDPKDADGLKPEMPVFVIDLELPDLPVQRVGSRARVRIDLPPESLGARAVFRARQLLLRHFAQVS